MNDQDPLADATYGDETASEETSQENDKALTLRLRGGQDTLTKSECIDLADLHIRSLPGSFVTRLGAHFAGSFYRYIQRSRLEFLFVSRINQRLASACVLSLSSDSLPWRLVWHTSILFWAAFRPLRLPLAKSVRGKLQSGADGDDAEQYHAPKDLPELILIFTDAEARGRGLGRSLLGRCEDFLRSRGIKGYFVKTIDDERNAATIFYASNGFQLRGCLERHRKRYQVWEKQVHGDHVLHSVIEAVSTEEGG